MKPITSKKTASSKPLIAFNFQRRIVEGLLILCMAIAIYLLLAFVTYHMSDAGWSTTGSGIIIKNAGGKIGAWIADVFLYTFGYMAYLFPIMFACSAWRLFYDQRFDRSIEWDYLIFRLVGFLILLTAACALSSIYLPHFAQNHHYLPGQAGGILGDVISRASMTALNQPGAILLLSAGLLIGITVFSGLSWLVFFGLIGKAFVSFLSWLHAKIIMWIDHMRDSRAKESEMLDKITIKAPKKIKADESTEPLLEKKVRQPIQIRLPQPKQEDLFKYAPSTELPELALLDPPKPAKQQGYTQEKLEELSRDLEKRLLEFEVEAYVVAVHPGPVITRFELELAPGIKASKVSALSKDIARSLSMPSVRVVEVIPGKPVIGIEVPNQIREVVALREVLESRQFAESPSFLSLGLGKDIAGASIAVDLAKMPHLLVAGTTGAGKSVSLNAMILSVLYKATPEDVRLILIDPKMLELSVYADIPHLLTPVVTDMKEAANAFRWCVAEMDRRYQLMSVVGVRNIESYNKKINEAIAKDKPIPNPLMKAEELGDDEEIPTLEPMPYVLLVVDELSDMMMVVGKKVEELIARIAQKARAAGIHMILATQRPSVDVITGLIKANIPTRIAFQVSSKIDSRTIIDQQGAEQLLGNGDMLYLPPGTGLPMRIHGAYVSDNEIHRVASAWKERGKPQYLDEILQDPNNNADGNGSQNANGEGGGEQDPLYDQAAQIVITTRRASISYVQRRLRIGYNRAANLLETMERTGVVSSMESNGAREVLVPAPQSTEDEA